jgi:hypothetical protein
MQQTEWRWNFAEDEVLVGGENKVDMQSSHKPNRNCILMVYSL